MKVIIVANQKEIGQNSYLANQELKYLVAAHENIIFEEESQPNKVLRAYEDKAKEIHGPVDINMVKTRMNELFGQDALYEKVKEKLVGITVFY